MDDTDYLSLGFNPSWAQDPATGYSVPQAIGLPSNSAAPLPADMADMGQMQPYVIGGDQMPWYESVIKFGMTRAVDNLSRTNVGGNTDPGSFAGYNGGTYSQVPQGSGGGATRTATRPSTVSGSLTGSPLMLLALAAVAYALLK